MVTWAEELLFTVSGGRFATSKQLTHLVDPVADPAMELERKATSRDIANALLEIGEQEAVVLRLRFGLGASPMSINEVAVRMALSRERVRQIEERALLRLRRVLTRMEYAG